jgi:hypothetical protein
MAAKRRQLTGLLRTPIDLGDARPKGLRMSFGLPPDEKDVKEHIVEQICARYAALDEFFELKADGQAGDIWDQRIKALVAYLFNIDPSDPIWREKLAHALAGQIPGFSIKKPNRKRHGAPREWDDERLSQLFADIEFLKKKTGMSGGAVCKDLPRRKGYSERWGRCRAASLRKAYTAANKYRGSVLFQFVLCGRDATIPSSGIDHVAAAIERHALKI